MRISHRKKFIFFSKPKCASESVRRVLNSFSDIFSTSQLPYYHHVTALYLKNHFSQKKWDWNQYYKFITLRNPWDVLVSFYHYAKPDMNGIYFYEDTRNEIKRDENNLMSFEEWVLNKKIKKSWHNLLYRNGRFYRNLWTNDFYFLTLNNFILDDNGISLVDAIIKVEELEKGLTKIFNKIGIPFKKIARLNATDHKHYRFYYSEETKKVVETEFKYDIEKGEYEF
jgi:hypothetical protein